MFGFFKYIFVKIFMIFFFFKVIYVSIVFVIKDFNLEKYEILCRIFLRKYRKFGNFVFFLESYFSVFIRGSCSIEENGRFLV